ncbi:glycosyltransferase family 32 protein [Vibrio metschnikovii]|uniref:glycosyltransferase family 32 protein n=1 Tax=Vibrio metschnikovii TaxID=28172 RepID=UPI001C2FF79B|nr:glycosyltransferase [Vibrio metschnikovii]
MNKTIHAIWLGKKMTPLSFACVDDWHKQGYTVRVWTEQDEQIIHWIECCEFAQACFRRGLYAFVTDYLRLKVLQAYGGLYLDTDVTIQKDPFYLFNNCKFSVGYEDNNHLGTAIIYSDSNSIILQALIDFYEIEILSSSLYMGPGIMTEIVIKRHWQEKEKVCLYSPDYFYAYQGEALSFHKPENSHLIHWFQHSWKNPRKEVYLKSKHLSLMGRFYVWQKSLFRFKRNK